MDPPGAGFAAVAIGPLPPEALAAIAACGGRVVGTLDWETLEAVPAGPTVLIAAVPDDIGHGAIERLAAIVDDGGWAAVVAFEAAAIDAVAASLLGARVELLCDPSPVDWAVALALATQPSGAVSAAVREGGDEAERLRRLHGEVARIAALLAGLVEEAPAAAASVDDRRRGYGVEPAAEVAIDAADIRLVIRGRRLRAQFFDSRLLEDPGWDMLLDLFAAELERVQVSVSSLCIAAAVAPTTALRWISRMAEAGLMVRVADTGDRRRAFVALSAAAGQAMRRYVDAARRAGVPIA